MARTKNRPGQQQQRPLVVSYGNRVAIPVKRAFVWRIDQSCRIERLALGGTTHANTLMLDEIAHEAQSILQGLARYGRRGVAHGPHSP